MQKNFKFWSASSHKSTRILSSNANPTIVRTEPSRFWKPVSTSPKKLSFLIVKEFLPQRKYVPLCKKLMDVMPVLFNFEDCGVLFLDR